jgi:hypothetical protein
MSRLEKRTYRQKKNYRQVEKVEEVEEGRGKGAIRSSGGAQRYHLPGGIGHCLNRQGANFVFPDISP